MWIRLRQVALVARNLQEVLDDLNATFGLEVAYRDPGVATFGLQNAVLPVGTQFIEVVSPVQENTAAGRQLDRRGGDGGYMVITHTDDDGPVRQRVEELGIRTPIKSEGASYHVMQLHPRDTGGSFFEIDWQQGGEDPFGPWEPAGPDWQKARRTEIVDGIRGLDLEAADPERVAARWSQITEIAVEQQDDVPVLPFDNAVIRFLPPGTDGPDKSGDTIVGVDLFAVDAPAALAAASERGLPVEDQTVTICGIRFRL
jgi:hypothetical protein